MSTPHQDNNASEGLEQGCSSGRIGGRWFRRALALTLTLGATQWGCPSYEDTYTGTWQEVPDADDLPRTEQLLALEFFRYGDYAQALVRTYRSPLTAPSFDRQTGCMWTSVGEAPEEDGTFRLRLVGHSAPSDGFSLSEVSGRFISSDELEASVVRDGETLTKRFIRRRDEASNRCDAVGTFRLVPSFDQLSGEPNTLAPESGALRRPVFTTLWAGVRGVRQGGAVVWVANDRSEPWVYLHSSQRDGARGLRGSLTFSIPAPNEDVMITSGRTRYALAHLIVVDDACPSEGGCEAPGPEERFRWEQSSEPIVATLLDEPNPPDSPFPEARGMGKAIFFVEGRLDELHESLQSQILNVEAYEEVGQSAHFYIVDVFYDETAIVGMRLPEDPAQMARYAYRKLPMKMTDAYQGVRDIALPRLLPLDEF